MVHKHHGAERIVAGDLPRTNAAMNITPMIDVLLVLIVIFMTALPLNQRGVDVNLPPPAGPEQPLRAEQIVVEYTGDRRLSINRQDVAHAELGERLRTLFESRADKTLFVMADGSSATVTSSGSSMPPKGQA